MMQEAVLLHVCGKDEGTCVRGILNAVADKATWSKYSVAGQTGKKALKDTPLYRVIQGVYSCFNSIACLLLLLETYMQI